MAHLKKYTRSATGHILKHFERAKNESGEYISFGNQDIDPARTYQNYNLAPTEGTSQLELLQKRCSEVRCMKRDDVKVMCSWVVTAPQEIVGSSHEAEFLQRTYNFLSERYGAENVISAYVHMDETTPHMHFAFVPVAMDKKRGDLKVSAKEVVTKVDLQSFHQDLDQYLEKTMGQRYPGGILNDATKDGNRSIEELKQKSATERMRSITDARNIMLRDVIVFKKFQEEVREQMAALEAQNIKLTKANADLESLCNAKAEELQNLEQEIYAATAQKSMLEKSISVLKRDRSTLLDDAELVKRYSDILENGSNEPLPCLKYLNLSNQDFSYLCLQGADLTGSIISESDFSYTHLENANLSGVVAIKTNFTDTYLENAQYETADFTDAIFKEAIDLSPNIENFELER